MCFSASASFVVAGALSITGLVSLYLAKNRIWYRLASIPFFFAAQQAAEGVVWLTMNRIFIIEQLATYAFLFFAFIFWPVWFAWMLLPIESAHWRRLFLYACLCAGGLFALAALAVMVLYGFKATAMGHHIVYNLQRPSTLVNDYIPQASAVYFFATVIPLLISSKHTIQAFGTLIAILYVVSQIFYNPFIISVWCFFGAVVSIGVCVIVYKEQNLRK